MGQVVKYGEFESYAANMKSTNERLLENLNDIKSLINSLSGEWESNSAVTIRQKISGMQPKFEQYYDVVNNYVTFIKNTGEQYKATENTLDNKAEQFI